MRFHKVFGVAFLLALLIAVVAYAGNLNTSGKCPRYAGCVLGDSTTTTFTITTDGTGNGEFVVPTGSISGTEILDGTVAATDIATNGVEGAEILDSVCVSVVAVFINPTEAGATDDYINLVDSSIGTTDAAEDEFVVPAAMRANNLSVTDVTDPGAAGDIWEVTLMDDGAATALTCNVGNGETSCTDTTNNPSIAAGSDLTIRVDSSTATDPDASANMRVAFCLAPE